MNVKKVMYILLIIFITLLLVTIHETVDFLI